MYGFFSHFQFCCPQLTAPDPVVLWLRRWSRSVYGRCRGGGQGMAGVGLRPKMPHHRRSWRSAASPGAPQECRAGVHGAQGPACRAPFKNSALLGDWVGLGWGGCHPPAPATSFLSDGAKFFFGPLANQKLSLAPSVQVSLGQKFSSASSPPKTQHHWGVGRWTHPPTHPRPPPSWSPGRQCCAHPPCTCPTQPYTQATNFWLSVTNAIEADTCCQGDSAPPPPPFLMHPCP